MGHNGTATRSGYKLKPSDSKTYLITEKHLEYNLYTINGRKYHCPDTYVAKISTKHNTWILIPIVYSKRLPSQFRN